MSRRKKDEYPDQPARYLAEIVHEVTGGGVALVEFLEDVRCGRVEGATVRDRIDAAKFLTERGYGKSPQPIEVTGRIDHRVAHYDLSRLTDEQLRALESSLAPAALEAGDDADDETSDG